MISTDLEDKFLDFIYSIANDEGNSPFKEKAQSLLSEYEEESYRYMLKSLFSYEIRNYDCDAPFLNDKTLFVAKYCSTDNSDYSPQRDFIEENWDNLEDILQILQELIQEREETSEDGNEY